MSKWCGYTVIVLLLSLSVYMGSEYASITSEKLTLVEVKDAILSQGWRGALSKPGSFKWVDVPKEYRTPEVWALGIWSELVDTSAVPDSIRGPEYYKTLVKLGPDRIQAVVPEKYLTSEVILAGFEYFGRTWGGYQSADFDWLSHVPSSAWNHDLAVKAAFCGGLEFIPDSLVDKDVVANALLPGSRIKWYFRFIPDREKNPTLCEKAVTADPTNIKFVPNELVDRKLALRLAVQSPSFLGGQIPSRFLSRRFYLDIVKANGAALEYIPWPERDKEMCLAALENSNAAWDFVPKKLIFDEKFMSSLMASK